jgi:hypothetical protein
MSKKIKESTIKSREENMHRKFRKTHKHKHRDDENRKPTIDPTGRITPKKTGNTDPTRRGQQKRSTKHLNLSCDLDRSLRFVAINMKHTGEELQEAVQAFPYKERLFDLVSHMVAVSMGGWKKEGGRFINESGREASPADWNLRKDGHLTPLTKTKPVRYNVDWLLEVRQYCGEAIK